MRSILLAISAGLFFSSVASAQAKPSDDPPLVIYIVLARLEKLAAEPTIQKLRPGATDISLLRETPIAEYGRLSDSAIVAVQRLMGRTLEHANVTTCGETWVRGPGVTSETFLRLIATSDSALSKDWAESIAQLARAGVEGRVLGGAVASQVEMKTAIAAARAQLPSPDQALITRLQAGVTLSTSDQCRALRAIYRGYGLLDKRTAGPVLRAMFAPQR